MATVPRWRRIVAMRDKGASFEAIGEALAISASSAKATYYRHRSPQARAATLAGGRLSSRRYREKRAGGAA